MGGETSRPSLENSKSPEKLNEINKCYLSQIEEVIDYWQRELYSRRSLRLEHFDEIFGHLFGDSEIHFIDFSTNNKADTREVLIVLILLCRDSPQKKVQFLFDFFGSRNPKVKRDAIKSCIEYITIGISRVFNTSVPSSSDILAFVNASFTFSNLQKFEKNLDDGTVDDGSVSIASNSTPGIYISFISIVAL